MGKCFVIQPFDKGKFDKRYEDIYSRAIQNSGLEPYRVDQDPHVSIPIDDIESGIESSDACLADITIDNPNVWFELGFAIASKVEVILLCSDERTSRFPFDIQHRKVIQYSTESSSDFESLQSKITDRLKAILEKKSQLGKLSTIRSVAKVEGLEQYEIAALISCVQNLDTPEDSTAIYRIRQDMESTGFTKIATMLGIKALLDKGFLEATTNQDYDGDFFTAYKVRDAGMTWLFSNQNTLTLKQNPS